MQIGYGFKPFWFWNGDMSDAEIIRQIEEMHSQGVDGFFIHPRQGLGVSYLSEEWFAKVGVAVDAAKRLGMEVWLYDEYTYPSGAAGGRIMIEHPELMARNLKILTEDITGGKRVSFDYEWGKVLDVTAVPMVCGELNWDERVKLDEYVGAIYPGMAYQDSGLTSYNKKRFFSEGCKWNLTWDAPAGDWRIYFSLEVEMRSFKYFDTFIDPVNPEAVRLFIEYTHELYRKHFGHEFGKTIKGIFADETTPWGYEGQLPWSPIMPNLYKQAVGRDICPLLPVLVDDMGGDTSVIRRDFFKIITDAFIENFDGQICRWCEKHGLISTGEKPILTVGQLKYSHIPGVDAGHHKAGDLLPIGGADRPWFRAMPKIAASAAHFYHDDRSMVEAFHSLGWDVTMQDLKYSIDVFSVCGLNVIVPHAYFYSTDGMRKHDAPPSCFFQLPQWKYTGALSQHMLDTWRHLQGRRLVDVLLLDNSTSFYTMGRKDLAEKNEYRQAFADLHEALLLNQHDFYVIDPEMLVESEIADKKIIVNDEAFKVLIIGPGKCFDEDILAYAQRFEKSGGAVVRAGLDVAEVVKQVRQAVAPVYEFASDKILSCVYEIDGELRIFALNVDGAAVDVSLKIQGVEKNVLFDAFESKFIRFTDDTISIYREDVSADAQYTPLRVDEAWEMVAALDNVLGLREWTLALPDGQKGIVGYKPLINQFVDAGFRLTPKYTQGFGTQPKMFFPAMDVEYTAVFTADVAGEFWLATENDCILGDFDVWVNGNRLGADAFSRAQHGGIGLNRAAIGQFLKIGDNTVKVCVRATESWHGIVDVIYIMGDFGVKGNKLIEMPKTGVPFKYIESGLPFYAGDVVYKTTVDINHNVGVELNLPDNMGLAAHLAINGHDLGSKCYSPYRWQAPAEILKQGANEVVMTVSTGLSPFYEGEYVDPVTHEIIKI